VRELGGHKHRAQLKAAELLVIDNLFLRKLPASAGDELADVLMSRYEKSSSLRPAASGGEFSSAMDGGGNPGSHRGGCATSGSGPLWRASSELEMPKELAQLVFRGPNPLFIELRSGALPWQALSCASSVSAR
jgi:hypothetical protein